MQPSLSGETLVMSSEQSGLNNYDLRINDAGIEQAKV